MNHRYCFETLNRTLRDILSTYDVSCKEKPFGGKTILLGGDFRQTLPVTSYVNKHETLNASITKSKLWSYCHVYALYTNMRLQHPQMS